MDGDFAGLYMVLRNSGKYLMPRKYDIAVEQYCQQLTPRAREKYFAGKDRRRLLTSLCGPDRAC